MAKQERYRVQWRPSGPDDEARTVTVVASSSMEAAELAQHGELQGLLRRRKVEGSQQDGHQFFLILTEGVLAVELEDIAVAREQQERLRSDAMALVRELQGATGLLEQRIESQGALLADRIIRIEQQLEQQTITVCDLVLRHDLMAARLAAIEMREANRLAATEDSNR